MITQSDNTATNMVVGLVGTANVNRTMESYGIVETKLFRPTFRGGKADVLPELEKEFGLGMTTPREMARLMELIADKKAVSPQASEADARDPEAAALRRHDPARPAGGGRGRRTRPGRTRRRSQAPMACSARCARTPAIVAGPKARYVVAILTRQVDDTRWSVDNDALVIGGAISRLIYDAFNKP